MQDEQLKLKPKCDTAIKELLETIERDVKSSTKPYQEITLPQNIWLIIIGLAKVGRYHFNKAVILEQMIHSKEPIIPVDDRDENGNLRILSFAEWSQKLHKEALI